MIEQLTDLIDVSANNNGTAMALKHRDESLTYRQLADRVDAISSNLVDLGLRKHDRVGIFAGKQLESVIAIFAATKAGGTFVPINTLFKSAQAEYILRDCNVRILVTTSARLNELQPILADCPDLRHVVVVDKNEDLPEIAGIRILSWHDLLDRKSEVSLPRVIGSDMAAIMYTSGSTGRPKGVVLSHANLTIGAQSVASYLNNSCNDRILAVLPFSFDAGFSQLTTGFSVGACVVLQEYFLPQDVVRIVERERITGITGVPPLWMQLADQRWPDGAGSGIRYFANTGGKMPLATLQRLRAIFDTAEPFLMYGLTESFRSTYLPPSEVDNRPDSIGKAAPNVEVLVVRPDGTRCDPGESGELVHRGPLVSMGYWNDPERTAERFRPSPVKPGEVCTEELAVWSGDTVRADEEGFLYFVGRKDDMIKTSGYRISPTEIEELVFETGLVSEVAALGVPHDRLGQAILIVAKPAAAHEQQDDSGIIDQVRAKVPNYMVPHAVEWKDSLPRNANGKIDRKTLSLEYSDLFKPEDRQ